MTQLLHSRKFWLMVTDLVFSTALYFAARYADPRLVEDARFLIAALQPVILLVIASITAQNVAGMHNAK